jgi:CO/xanthine dehydrogenase FAD-binding subunit
VISFTYLEPASLDEALALLAQHGDQSKLIAGGTGLINLMKQRLVRPSIVIGLRALKGLAAIEENGELRIGALATLQSLAMSEPYSLLRAATGRSLQACRDRANTIHGNTRRRDGTG